MANRDSFVMVINFGILAIVLFALFLWISDSYY